MKNTFTVISKHEGGDLSCRSYFGSGKMMSLELMDAYVVKLNIFVRRVVSCKTLESTIEALASTSKALVGPGQQ